MARATLSNVAVELVQLRTVDGRLTFFVPAPRGLVGLLARELRSLGAEGVAERAGGVAAGGPLELGYRICLWSRVANRVLLEIAHAHADSPDALYEASKTIDWRDHLAPDQTFAVQLSQAQSSLSHTHFAALRVKDAVVDQWRDRTGARPTVDVKSPDLRIHVHVLRREVTYYVDLSGESLHRRGYRVEGVAAPLKENVAAGLLLRAGWPERARDGAPLIDPMCGSGTFLIEAAWMAGDVAPGVLRSGLGAPGWTGNDVSLWRELREEVEERRRGGRLSGSIVGSDVDARAVRAAVSNLDQAGLVEGVRVERGDLSRARSLLPREVAPGLVICNPPYGERLGERVQAEVLFGRLGDTLRRDFAGWRAALIATDSDLAARLGLRARRRLAVNNGPIECQLLEFDLLDKGERARRQTEADLRRSSRREAALEGAFANRLRKNLKRLRPWLRQEEVSCFRAYDADIPEYAVAVDVYGDWVHVQEFEPPKTVNATAARDRIDEVTAAVPAVLEVATAHVVLKTRARQRGRTQYRKQSDLGELLPVAEGGCRFLVNLRDYLDTGLFLDGRTLRQLIRERAQGRRFLNLFAYTGAATVAAIAGGAKATTTVDLSNTRLEWARRNLELNGAAVGRRHRLERADCLEWLRTAGGRFGLIYLDPPTFSNSKRMAESFDVQRDHVELIRGALRRMADDGELWFVTNRRGFKLDRDELGDVQIEEWTQKTVPRDFKRTAHKSYRMTR